MPKIFQLALAVLMLSIFSLASANAVNESYIEAEGVVYYRKGMDPNAMRRMAIMDAYRYLAEETNNLHVTSESTVKNMRDMDDVINTKIEAALRGAKVISVNRERDGSFHAKVRLNIYGDSRSLAGAVLPEVHVEDFPKPKFTNIRTEIRYTGLVVDCRGLNLLPAIVPSIKSVSGVEVYAYKNVGYQDATSKGMVEYSSSLDSPRAGSSPLVIKATKLSGACDIIISDDDADKILAINQSTNILVNCAVVLVR